jgi:hypothetical protein
MDEWSPKHALQMLEGGNEQLTGFFTRHHLSPEALEGSPNTAEASQTTTVSKENVTQVRYRTKAALFYRQQLDLHVDRVLSAGPYRGRELSRRLRRPRIDHRNTTRSNKEPGVQMR